MEFQIVDNQKAQILRQKFIKKFVNAKAEHYHEYVEMLKLYSDGLCYDGYLWDFLKDNNNYEKRYSMETVLNYLRKKKEVYVMWDIYSNERVRDGSRMAIELTKGTIIHLFSG